MIMQFFSGLSNFCVHEGGFFLTRAWVELGLKPRQSANMLGKEEDSAVLPTSGKNFRPYFVILIYITKEVPLQAWLLNKFKISFSISVHRCLN